MTHLERNETLTSLILLVNGDSRSVPDVVNPAPLDTVLTALSVRKELIAVALNDVIVPRTLWQNTSVVEGDRIEIVHFVGGGSSQRKGAFFSRSSSLLDRETTLNSQA